MRVTDEDEYFPPRRELRELIPRSTRVAAFAFGGDPNARARASAARSSSDRGLDASAVLARLDG